MPKKCPRCGVKHYKVDGSNCLNCGYNFSLHIDRDEKRENLKNLREELKEKQIKLERVLKRKKKISADPFFNAWVVITCPTLLIVVFITIIIFFGIIQSIIFLLIISVILSIWFIFMYIIYLTPFKLKRECRELEIKILEKNRKSLKEKQEQEIKTQEQEIKILNEDISCLIKEGERLLISKNFYDALQKFENALKIFNWAQDKYQQKILTRKTPKIFDENLEKVINSKIKFVGNKINEEFLKKIKLNIESGEIFKNQKKFKDALQEYEKALNIADEMFSSDEKNKKIKDIKAKIDDIYLMHINKFILQGNQLKSQNFFDKTIRIFNSALDLSHKIYNSIDKDEAQNKIKNCFDSLYSDMIKEKIKTGNQLRKDLQYDDPIKIFRKSIKIAEKLYDSSKKNDKISKLKSLIHQTQIAKIKNTILNLGTKFGRLHIMEISEECGEDESLIISTVREMIEGNEIYAKYFESSKSVAFDQQANIEEIDKLMASYKEWEEKEVGKK